MLNPEHLEITVPDRTPLGGQTTGDLRIGVRVVHKPTGTEAFCEASRSQLKNKRIACEMIEWALSEIGW